MKTFQQFIDTHIPDSAYINWEDFAKLLKIHNISFEKDQFNAIVRFERFIFVINLEGIIDDNLIFKLEYSHSVLDNCKIVFYPKLFWVFAGSVMLTSGGEEEQSQIDQCNLLLKNFGHQAVMYDLPDTLVTLDKATANLLYPLENFTRQEFAQCFLERVESRRQELDAQLVALSSLQRALEAK